MFPQFGNVAHKYFIYIYALGSYIYDQSYTVYLNWFD